jgi:hypothetical protein
MMSKISKELNSITQLDLNKANAQMFQALAAAVVEEEED